MNVLGFSGGPNAAHEKTFEVFPGGMHDSAAVLLRDGEVVAAIEQERLDRIKHSNKGAFDAIRFCLATSRLRADQLDRIVFYGDRAHLDWMLRRHYLQHFDQTILVDSRTLLRSLLERELGSAIPEGQPEFVHHHRAHAVSAAAMSGFERSLVVTLDGEGDGLAGAVFDAHGADLQPLASLPVPQSLGYLYLNVIEFLGFRIFDEYKVMGLAPYGDGDRFKELFQTFYTLEPEGRWVLHMDRLRGLFEVCKPRRPAEPVTQLHQDVSAALQRSLEEIVMHLLRHHRETTGHRNLCLAGGVAHNCTMNGRILRSGLFDEVFVQPASHDAGCALGAALYGHYQAVGPRTVGPRLSHVYWGTDIGDGAAVEKALLPWAPWLEFERVDDPCAAAAELLAAGQVLGWVQGRSEFGPRALGNRSIVADPRPAGNKDLINAMVKKREAFRPFAPSVLEERVHDFFDLPAGVSRLPFMVFTVDVQPHQREVLGAVTHVDGSARIQTVSRQTNERYWRLIDEFGRRTGVPVILNTSFNNNAEPIVDSVKDAVVCFLTTQLHALVVGDYLVRKRAVPWTAHLDLVPTLPRHVEMEERRSFVPGSPGGWVSAFSIASNVHGSGRRALSGEAFALLTRVDGRSSLRDLMTEEERAAEGGGVMREILDLWALRLVALAPADPSTRRSTSDEPVLVGAERDAP